MHTVDHMISDLFRPWRSTQTWWTLVHLLTGAVTASVIFSLVFTVLVTAVSLVVLVPVAIALLWFTLVLASWSANIDRSRFAALLNVELTDLSPPPSTDAGRWARMKATLLSPQRWREVAWSILHFPPALFFATIAPWVWAGSAVLATLPAWIWLLPEDRSQLGWFQINSGWQAAVAGVLGLVGLTILAPWLTVAMGNADIALARWLLGRSREAELGAKVDALETSRSAAIDSAEAERRRIERDLHDGAQQRLIAVAMDLGLARNHLDTDHERAKELVASAHDEVKAAMKELRDLIRGVHPVILEDRGLDAALSAVAARAIVPVTLLVDVPTRPSPAIESAAYFIVSESLVNVDRHARASRATVEIARVADRLTIAVTDDGIGGASTNAVVGDTTATATTTANANANATTTADAGQGTGLNGLVERVSALGGWIRIISPGGGPTTILVELPCES